MAILNTSTLDMVFAEDEQHSTREEIYSPQSNYSSYSQEVKYIFDPNFRSQEDYSQIKLPTRREQPPPPPLRTSSTASYTSEHSKQSLEYNKPTLTTQRSHSGNYSLPHYYPNNNQSRRRTWSPPRLKVGTIPSNSNLNGFRSFHSNDQLDNDYCDIGNPIYEDPDSAPPKLAPVSGILTRSPARGIIRPIAFKPVLTSSRRYVEPARGYKHRKPSGPDDGYSSQDYPLANQNASNTSHGSVFMESDKSASFSSDCVRPCDRPDSLPSSNTSRLSSNQMDSYVQTPSPSDSGVGELEAMLKEKDAEINTLRDVMDKNERAIFQVHDEKNKLWSREVNELRDDYERKLKIHERKAYKTEQVLSLQIYKLQQDKKAKKEDFDKLRQQKEELEKKCESYANEVSCLKSQLSGQSPQICEASGGQSELQNLVGRLTEEISQKTQHIQSLKSDLEKKHSHLEEKSKETSYRFKNILAKTEEVKALKADLGRLSASTEGDADISLCSNASCEMAVQTDFSKEPSPEIEMLKPSILAEKNRQLTALKDELGQMKQVFESERDIFEKDKGQWLEEKNKVVRYQKQLQLNYVQMFRKNKVLEAEVEQLTLELESRDLKLMALNGSEESVC
ncbi:hypothetical protein ScPMuIL_002063 [Solemya velum]